MTITPEELAKTIPATEPPRSFTDEFGRLMGAIDGTYDAIERIWARWRDEFLYVAKPGTKDPDEYAKPLLKLAEFLRRRGLQGLVEQAFTRAITDPTRTAHRWRTS
jgi:hypothetical protein